MAFNNSGSTTTSGMCVGDSQNARDARFPIQVDAMPDPNTTEGQKPLPKGAQGGTINTGLAVNDHQVPNPVAKPVDFRTITGSYAGDHRMNPGDVAKASIDRAADNGGPRQPVGQFKDSKFEGN